MTLERENEIRRLVDARLREFTIMDIRRGEPAVFEVPWVLDLTLEERQFERAYREQKVAEFRARFPRRPRYGPPRAK